MSHAGRYAPGRWPNPDNGSCQHRAVVATVQSSLSSPPRRRPDCHLISPGPSSGPTWGVGACRTIRSSMAANAASQPRHEHHHKRQAPARHPPHRLSAVARLGHALARGSWVMLAAQSALDLEMARGWGGTSHSRGESTLWTSLAPRTASPTDTMPATDQPITGCHSPGTVRRCTSGLRQADARPGVTSPPRSGGRAELVRVPVAPVAIEPLSAPPPPPPGHQHRQSPLGNSALPRWPHLGCRAVRTSSLGSQARPCGPGTVERATAGQSRCEVSDRAGCLR